MTEWRRLYAARDWAALEDWFWRTQDTEGRAQLLASLKRDVPTRRQVNGTEAQEAYVTEVEAPKEWKGAARILELGELEAMVEQEAGLEPVGYATAWRDGVETIRERLAALLDAEEVTEGDPSLSRRALAEFGLRALNQIDIVVALMADEIDPDRVDPDSREWLEQALLEAAFWAYRVGLADRGAAAKTIEVDAVRGRNTIGGASLGGQMRSAATKDATTSIIKEMQRLVGDRHSVKRAAELVHQRGLGTSPEANRQLYKRRRDLK